VPGVGARHREVREEFGSPLQPQSGPIQAGFSSSTSWRRSSLPVGV
jgi:hypothetical protein